MGQAWWKRKSAILGAVLAVGAGITLSFQACGEPERVRFLDHEAAFFNYRYKAAPKFYAEILLYRDASQVEGLSEFKFVGAAAHATDSAKHIEYRVRITTPDEDIVCPTRTGTFAPGESTIEFDCSSQVQTDRLRVELYLKAGSDEETVVKNY